MKSHLINTFALVAALVMSKHAFAEVPNTFSAGTPAKASEVNENFEALDTRISEIQLEKTITVDCAANTDALRTELLNLGLSKTTINFSGSCSFPRGVLLTGKKLKLTGHNNAVIRGAGSIADAMFQIDNQSSVEFQDLEISTASGNINLFASTGNSYARMSKVKMQGTSNKERGLQTAILVLEGSVLQIANIDISNVTYGIAAMEGSKVKISGDTNIINASGTSGKWYLPSAALFISDNSLILAKNAVLNGYVGVQDNSTFKLDTGGITGIALVVRNNSVVSLDNAITLSASVDSDATSIIYGSAW